MRPRLRRPAQAGLALLLGCSPVTLEVEPAEGSARGGEALTLWGRRLPQDAEVWVGGAAAPQVARVDRRELEVISPPGLAGAVDVEVRDRRGRGAPLAGGFLYLALDLDFARAPDHYLPQAPAAVTELVAGDLDADGISEILLLESSGAVRLWRGEGQGALVEAEPLDEEGVAGLALARGPGGLLRFTCYGDGRAPTLVDGASGEALERPMEGGACLGARAQDLDGDGVDELIELRAGGARVWRVTGSGAQRLAGAEVEDAESCGDVLASEGGEASCVVEDGVARLSVSGAGLATWSLPLPPVALADAGFTLELDGVAPALRVIDAVGQSFSLAASSGGGPRVLRTLPVSEWGEAAPVPPLQRLELDVGAGELALDRALLHVEGGGVAWVEGFQRWPLDAPSEGAPVGVAAGPEGLALGGAWGLSAYLLEDGALRVLPGAAPVTDCAVQDLVTLDLEGDGRAELVVACAGQDRLLRSDGQGRWFDDSAASIPLDDAEAADLVAADLDRDGLPELLVVTRAGVDRLYSSDGARLVDRSPQLDLEVSAGLGALALDVDGDHDLDLLFVDAGGARLYILRGGG